MTLSRNSLQTIHNDNETKWLKPYSIISHSPIHSDVFYANSLKFRSFTNENENTLRNGSLSVKARTRSHMQIFRILASDGLGNREKQVRELLIKDTHHIHTRDDLPNVRHQVFSCSNEASQERLVNSGIEDKISYKALHSRLGFFPSLSVIPASSCMLNSWWMNDLALVATILNQLEWSWAQTTDATCLPYFDWVPSACLSSAIIPYVLVIRCLTRSTKAHASLLRIYWLFAMGDVGQFLLYLTPIKITNI